MSEPRTFRARMLMLQAGRPLSPSELAPQLGITGKAAAGVIENLVSREMARAVRVPGCKRLKYEATNA